MSSVPDPLVPDCSACAALCCVALTFEKSADFPERKRAGTPCRHLGPDHRCTIHAQLRDRGYAGCIAFDCLGAGQRLTAALEHGEVPPAGLLLGLRHQHLTLWLLREAEALDLPAALQADVRAARAEVRSRAEALDTAPSERALDALRRVSAHVRSQAPGPRHDRSGALLVGADLRRTDLRGASLRGSVLVGARLQGVDLTGADLTGADLRGAQLHGANLSDALFLHRSQIASAHGDGRTRLPERMPAPAHWGPG